MSAQNPRHVCQRQTRYVKIPSVILKSGINR